MNNNITEDYCSFEVSKLLKERGFNQVTLDAFITFDNWKTHTTDCHNNLPLSTFWNSLDDSIARPSTSLAIKWIRKNFKIMCTHTMPTKINEKWLFRGKIFSMLNEGDNITIGAFNSPEEATEAALLHTLKHLI